jgi:type I restriction enzyme S subunit
MGRRLSPYVGETERTLTDLGLRNSSAQMLPPNSVILSSRAPIGHLIINTKPMATNQGCKGLIPGGQLEFQFLYYYLSSIVDLLNSLGTGATFKELSGSKLKEVPIPVPLLSEQQRIVRLLDDAFDGLGLASANAERNLKSARAIFKSHLETVFAQRHKGWVKKPIAECFKVRSGDFLPARSMVEGGQFDVYGGNGINGKHDRTNLTGENIIIGRVGAKCGNVRYVSGQVWVTDNAVVISKYFCPFDLHFLTRLLERKDLRNRANQMAQPVISYTTIKDVLLEFPSSKEEQKSIADGLDAIEEETQSLAGLYERKLAALEALKKSLLHQAFAGQLRTAL